MAHEPDTTKHGAADMPPNPVADGWAMAGKVDAATLQAVEGSSNLGELIAALDALLSERRQVNAMITELEQALKAAKVHAPALKGCVP